MATNDVFPEEAGHNFTGSLPEAPALLPTQRSRFGQQRGSGSPCLAACE